AALGPVLGDHGGEGGGGPEARLPAGDLEPEAPADHLLRPGVLPGAAARPGRLPDLLLRRHEEADRGRSTGSPRETACAGRTGRRGSGARAPALRSEEHTSELQS